MRKCWLVPSTRLLGVFTGNPPSPTEFVRLAAFHRHAGDIAAGYGIRLAIEPMNRFEAHMLNRMDDLARHLESVGHPAVTALYDTFHANVEEADPVDALTRNMHHVGHVHISENHRGIPGTGHVPWAATFRALKQAGYDGWLDGRDLRPARSRPSPRSHGCGAISRASGPTLFAEATATFAAAGMRPDLASSRPGEKKR